MRKQDLNPDAGDGMIKDQIRSAGNVKIADLERRFAEAEMRLDTYDR